MSQDEIVLVILIFVLRALNNGMATFRIIMLTYGRRGIAFVLAFIESLIFVFTAAHVLTDLSNIPFLISYAGGFAVGGYIGMVIEDRFVTGYMTVNIISSELGHEIAVALRDKGYGVTETMGEGGKGAVIMLRAVVLRYQVAHVMGIARAVNPDAFITIEEARAVHRGWMRAKRNNHRS